MQEKGIIIIGITVSILIIFYQIKYMKELLSNSQSIYEPSELDILYH